MTIPWSPCAGDRGHASRACRSSLWLGWAARRAGVRLQLRLPALTPEVKQLGVLIWPAAFGAGVYQISQFSTVLPASLPHGSLTLL